MFLNAIELVRFVLALRILKSFAEAIGCAMTTVTFY